MAELAPVDAYGMPYAFVPSDAPNTNANTEPTEHHAFYRSRAPELSTDAGAALRYSRVHDEVERWLHDGIHKVFPGGLERLPQTEDKAFGLLVLSCAGYLSREGWHRLSNGKFELRPIDFNVYQKLRSRRYMHFETAANSRIPADGPNPKRTQDEAHRIIGSYLTNYAKRQNLDHLTDTDFVDEFLSTSDANRRHELGRLILFEALHVAVDPIKPTYQSALQDGLIRTPEPDPAQILKRIPIIGPWSAHIADLEQKFAA